MSDLHPELQMIWDEVKNAVQEPVKWASKVAQVYHEQGAKNRELMNKVPGLVPLMDATASLAETPGTDVFMPMPTAFTKASAANDIATGLFKQGKRLSEGGARGAKELASRIWNAFEPEATRLIEGPHPNLTPESRTSWKWVGPDVRVKGHYVRRGNEDVFVPHGGEEVLQPAQIQYPINKLHKSLEQSYGNAKIPPRDLKKMMDQGGEMAPFHEEVFGGAHEVGHDVDVKLNDDIWRQMFKFPSNLNLYDLQYPGPEWLRMQAGGIRKGLEDFGLHNNLYVPSYLQDKDRILYWLFGDPRKYGNRIYDELGSDLTGLGALGWPIKDLKGAGAAVPSFQLDPIVSKMRLNNIIPATRTY
jgi:hypothetical protein